MYAAKDHHMESLASSDVGYSVIAALLRDVQNVHGSVFNTTNVEYDQDWLRSRFLAEGMGFLTKTLPRLGKSLDKALAGSATFDASELGMETKSGSRLPVFLGALFERILTQDGALLEQPCAQCVGSLRDLSYCFYKYELPYTDEQEQQVIKQFKETEDDLSALHPVFQTLEHGVAASCFDRRRSINKDSTAVEVARTAKILLARVFSGFDPLNIHPKHGPGAVATRQRLWGKYLWTNVAAKITDVYPLDAFFCASQGHVCDCYQQFSTVGSAELPAQVILVPKDSRGPRLISKEPVDQQWVQQGLGDAIVEWVEAHPLTRDSIHFTCQEFNRIGAYQGSWMRKYSTLDLKEASDRVSLDLVRLLFPSHVYTYLEACRSSSTVLPNGEVLKLKKFAPMGSCLCFPVMALTIWAILAAAAPDANTRDSILVYGDDVIVPTAYAENAIERLESFGLKVNRDKSCTAGLFRESCGMDAFNGVDVTPVRIRTVWSSLPRADVYESWIAYANSFFDKQYLLTYDYIVGLLQSIYGPIPDESMHLACPSLRLVPESAKPERRRINKALQRVEWLVRTCRASSIRREIDGWSMLLRFFAEATHDRPLSTRDVDSDEELSRRARIGQITGRAPFSVCSYTDRKIGRAHV